jgi:predicted nucleic acid-binding protein
VARFTDSSVLVRYLTDDDPPRARAAAQIVEHDDLVLTTLILSEVAYVLLTVYRYPRAEIADAMVELLARRNIAVLDADRDETVVALRKSRSGALSFGDALIIAQMRSSGHDEIYTFDRGFHNQGVRVLDALVD